MKEIDLGPNAYRKRVRGRWQLPNDRRFARVMTLASVGALLFVLINREQFSTGTMAGLTAVAAFVAGVFFALWIRD